MTLELYIVLTVIGLFSVGSTIGLIKFAISTGERNETIDGLAKKNKDIKKEKDAEISELRGKVSELYLAINQTKEECIAVTQSRLKETEQKLHASPCPSLISVEIALKGVERDLHNGIKAIDRLIEQKERQSEKI